MFHYGLVRHTSLWGHLFLMYALICSLWAGPVLAQAEASGSARSHWAYEYAEALFLMGVLGEIPTNLDRPAPRDLVIGLTVGVIGLAPPPGSTGQAFRDVDEVNPYVGEILAAKHAGIAKGNPDGLFSPGAALSRAELATILHRAFGGYLLPPIGDLTPFLDVRGHWALEDIMWCARGGLVSGFPDYTYGPEQPCSVGQVAKVLRVAMQRSRVPSALPADRELIAAVAEHNRRFGASFDSDPWDFEPLLETVTGEAHRNLKSNAKWLLGQQEAGHSYRYEAMTTEGKVAHKTALEATVLTYESMKEYVDGMPHDVSQSDVYFLRKTTGGWKIFR